MARSNKGEFYTFPLLLLRLCNNVYWHVWTEHRLQFSSTACENGTFVKKQTSQFLVALTVGIRKDIDGRKERGGRPGGRVLRNTRGTDAYSGGTGNGRGCKIEHGPHWVTTRCLEAYALVGGPSTKAPCVSKARLSQRCLHLWFSFPLCFPPSPQSISTDNLVLRGYVPLCSSGFPGTTRSTA